MHPYDTYFRAKMPTDGMAVASNEKKVTGVCRRSDVVTILRVKTRQPTCMCVISSRPYY